MYNMSRDAMPGGLNPDVIPSTHVPHANVIPSHSSDAISFNPINGTDDSDPSRLQFEGVEAMDTSSPRIGTPAVCGDLAARLAAVEQGAVDPAFHGGIPSGINNVHSNLPGVPGIIDPLVNQPPRSPAIATKNTTHHNAYPGTHNRPPHLQML